MYILWNFFLFNSVESYYMYTIYVTFGNIMVINENVNIWS